MKRRKFLHVGLAGLIGMPLWLGAATVEFSFQEGDMRRDGALIDAGYTSDATYVRRWKLGSGGASEDASNENFGTDGRLISGSNRTTAEYGPLRTLLEFDMSAVVSAAGGAEVFVNSVQLIMRRKVGGVGSGFTTQVFEYEFAVDETAATWSAPGAGDTTPGGTHSNLLVEVVASATDYSDLTFPGTSAFLAAVSEALAAEDHTVRLLVKHLGDNGSSSGQFFHVLVHDEDAAVELRPELIVTVSYEADDDGDGLPDAWEEAHGGTNRFHGGAADDDGDGLTDTEEYTAGTQPTNAASAFRMVQHSLSPWEVSFSAIPAAGPGYDGYARYYFVQRVTNGLEAAWATLPAYSNIFAEGQTVVVSNIVDVYSNAYIRGAVSMQKEAQLSPGADPLEMVEQTQATNAVRITVSHPQIVGLSAPNESRWGYYQFPTISRLPDDRLLVVINFTEDSDLELGRPGPAFTSGDGGKSWTPYDEVIDLTIGHSPLTEVYSNEFLCVMRQPGLSTAGITLPPLAGTANVYGTVNFYRLADFAQQSVRDFFATPPARRWTPGAPSWESQAVTWQITNGLARMRPANPVLPRSYVDNRIVKAYGKLYYADFKMNYLLPGGAVPANYQAKCMMSEDNGHTWTNVGLIAYWPSIMAGEPCLELTSDGALACVIRTTLASTSPMYMAYSSDEGYTWSAPVEVHSYGVMPRLLRLQNDVMLMSFGRPHVALKVSASGNARDWGDEMRILTGTWTDATCGYTHMIATGPDEALLVYSDFNHYEGGVRHKAVKVRRITADRSL